MNLPNWITVGRIALTPLVAWLPFVHSATLRGLAFVLFLVVAISDHYDGKLARARNEITNLGRLLDPLADKIFLLAVFIPMYMLQAPRGDWLVRLLPRAAEVSTYPFVTWGGILTPFPWWVLVIVLGREVAMTWFRQAANRRGVVIAAIGPGKAKATFQFIWVGAAYFWFAFRTYIEEHGFVHSALDQMALFAGFVGTVCMTIAVVLTVWSFGVYLRRYGSVLRTPRNAP
ncbi:MAG: CDP-alcohol phosphatidyltransferase family protein [Gemmatimonadetes bacterium]|nr:CDP-alcohol phosphatidyltransferase family protein [Gemmatimonadota bacterium]